MCARVQPISNTALKIVQSMKRDWMQTGRRPAGICGAAIFIAAHVHGCECTKREIIGVVHVGWTTVERRVVEFANSRAGDLTVADFEQSVAEQRLEEERVGDGLVLEGGGNCGGGGEVARGRAVGRGSRRSGWVMGGGGVGYARTLHSAEG